MSPQLLSKRETFKEQSYFDGKAQSRQEWIEKFEAAIADPETTPEHRRRLLDTVFRKRLELLITRYSQGETISALAQDFPKIISALAAYHSVEEHTPLKFEEIDAYVIALWLVALAILLDVDDSHFNALLHEVNNERRDALFDRLVAQRLLGRPQALTLMYPNPYQPLLEALDGRGEQQASLINKFLKNYYKGMKRTYWHDSHLGEDAGFFGYWCFELAAFVKMLKIDDSAFADNIFYPRDLVRREGPNGSTRE